MMVSSAVASRDDMKSTSICGSMTFSIWYNCIPWANQPAAFRNAFMIDALLAPLQNKEGDIKDILNKVVLILTTKSAGDWNVYH
jgi:hypothetical protein